MVAGINEKRFYELAWPHMDAVLRTAQCLTRCSADAEDLAQETMIKAFKAIATILDDTKAKAWLMTILRRARIDQIRSTKDESSLDQLELEPTRTDATPESNADAFYHGPDELLNSLSDDEVICALRELPKVMRWTLLLVDVEEMDQAEVAAVLGIPVGTVKSRLHRGRAILRVTLEHSRQQLRQAV